MSEPRREIVRAPEFPAGLEWLNVEQPLSLLGLRGKIVLLDFWTFCCINCMHVLPELRKLEERFADVLVVIGVHSAKFPAEAETFNIRQAVMRYGIRHPVVNDRDFILWRAYATRAWPTVVLIGPDGMIVGQHSGEFDGEALGDYIQQLVTAYEARGLIERGPLPEALERRLEVERILSFPGKVLVDPAGERIFVADTGHHRIAALNQDGTLHALYGAGKPGFEDGSGALARFRAPQGMALYRHWLLVADTENHAIRAVAVETGVVSTLAGTGSQALGEVPDGPARETPLNSPWDLLVVGDWLYVAMAGSHQLWRMDLVTRRIERFAGDGRETLKDGPRFSARLAQPSGLAKDGKLLWFVDSETSSVRSVPLAEDEGAVRTWIGQGLFEFGDVDGPRSEARLQHPLGITVAGDQVYVADSYNNKLKRLDPETGEIHALAGSGEPGLQDGESGEACFWEPGGICAAGDVLYVADTNNHAIRTVDRNTGAVTTLRVRE